MFTLYGNRIRLGVLAVIAALTIAYPAAAQMFYATGESTQQLDLVNFTTGMVTNLLNIGGRPDALVVNAKGQILYTVTSLGTLEMFDPLTSQHTVLANFGKAAPRDLLIEPSGDTVLVSLYGSGKLARYNVNTGAVTVFPAKRIGSTMDGLVYDPAGNLFAVVSRNLLCQLDPSTGTILQTVTLEPHNKTNGGDGIVYDPFTKNLWITHDGTLGNGLIEVPLTPTNPPRLGTPIWLQTGNIRVPDGIISDSTGNLYIGEGLQFLTQYNIASNVIVKRVKVKGIDSAVFVPQQVMSLKR
jgi:DNA-binding beta-propeller fold protein YncE